MFSSQKCVKDVSDLHQICSKKGNGMNFGVLLICYQQLLWLDCQFGQAGEFWLNLFILSGKAFTFLR